MKLIASSIILVLLIVMGFSIAWGSATVARDQYGIPSITADTEEELFEEFGYITAVDRLWQMEINRRWGKGTLAEIFGPNLVPSDMQNRLMNYTEDEYRAMFAQHSADTRNLFTAYLKGINRRVDEVLAEPKIMPMEYLALKLKPQHFVASDILAFWKSLLRRFGMIGGSEMKNLNALQILTARFGKKEGWEAFNDWRWINDPAAPTYMVETIGENFVPRRSATAGIPTYLAEDTAIAQWTKKEKYLAKMAFDEAQRVGAPIKLGSNTWTLSPQLTGTGYPILVGQPQMRHSVPTIINEVALKGGRFDVVGMTFPILPYPSATITSLHGLTWLECVTMLTCTRKF